MNRLEKEKLISNGVLIQELKTCLLCGQRDKVWLQEF